MTRNNIGVDWLYFEYRALIIELQTIPIIIIIRPEINVNLKLFENYQNVFKKYQNIINRQKITVSAIKKRLKYCYSSGELHYISYYYI